MNRTQKTDLNDNPPISITGYRTLLLLRNLYEHDMTIEEIVQLFKNDSITSKAVSKDTARITLNTLKNSGCKLTRPAKNNGYKYKLLSNPFSLNLDDEETEMLVRLRDNLSEKLTWQDMIVLNSLYKKIFDITGNEKQIQRIKETRSINEVSMEIINTLSNKNIIFKKVLIEYKSNKYGIEEIFIIPYKFVYGNNRLYVLCFCSKYNNNCLLEVSKILKVKAVNTHETYRVQSYYDVIYRISGISKDTYKPADYEEILQQTSSYIKVRAKVNDEFSFIQRLMLFGADFTIVSPEFFREKLINKIKLIRRNYKK